MNNTRDNSFYCCKNLDQALKTLPYPRRINDVYAFDTWLHYYLGDIYHNLSQRSQGTLKEQYSRMELRELEGEKQVLSLLDASFNQWVAEFGNNEGQLKAFNISQEQFGELKDSFDNIRHNFFHKMEDAIRAALHGDISASELESLINNGVIQMYQGMSCLFEIEEISSAFKNLISLRKNLA